MEFSILGPVDVTVGGRSLELSGARARAVLATLIVHANHVVAAGQLLDELWPLQPADRALASLQVRMSELRKMLRSAADSPGADRLSTRPPGYLLRVTPAELDSCRFTGLTAEAANAMAGGNPAIALHCLDEALRLWRGSALAGIDAPSVRTEAGRLEELRLAALEARATARGYRPMTSAQFDRFLDDHRDRWPDAAEVDAFVSWLHRSRRQGHYD